MRLIDVDELKEQLEPFRYSICGFEGVLALIDNAPTVDLWEIRQEATENALKKAMEAKNCRNCKYCVKTDKGLYCSHREGNPKVTGGGWCIDRQEKEVQNNR